MVDRIWRRAGAGPAEALQVRIRPAPGGVILEVAGRLTARTAARLCRRLRAAQAPVVVVDLRALAYLDAAGLDALARSLGALGARGHAPSLLLAAGGQPDRALRRAGAGLTVSLLYGESALARGGACGDPAHGPQTPPATDEGRPHG